MLLLVLAAPGCGRKGAPLPPLSRIPDAIAQIQARRVGNDVYVTFVIPSQNIDASKPGDVARVEIFAVTTDPFIVFTSNIFAIMGLRALYFLLADMVARFHYLKYGLAMVLVIIGAKMLAEHWVHVPVHWSLGVVGVILLASVGASWVLPGRAADKSARPEAKKSQTGGLP